MTEIWLQPKRVFDGSELKEDMALQVVDGKVIALATACKAPSSVRKIDGVVSAGFVDLQVNGGGDVLFNDRRDVKGITTIAKAHRRFGTTGILPTVITDAPEVLAEAIDAVIDAMGTEGILGIHIEGPHISVPRRGTHSVDFIRPMDAQTFQQVSHLRSLGIPVLITLAPEAASPSQISELAALGAVVSIGHSDATSAEAQRAIEAGVSCATHLFNAMSPMLNRAPGVTGAVINSDIAAGLIVDGIHVADEMVSLALRARPRKDSLFIVSDAMPTVGGADHFHLYGEDVKLRDGRLVNSEGSLAGAHLTQADGVKRLINVLGVDPTEALKMAISIPAKVIGRPDLPEVTGKQVSDLILLDNSFSFSGFLKV